MSDNNQIELDNNTSQNNIDTVVNNMYGSSVPIFDISPQFDSSHIDKPIGECLSPPSIRPFNQTEILFSVLLPVYNNKDDILNAIKSVIEQTINSWELIIIDDCSTDGTYETVLKFLKDNPNDKIILLRNTRNFGVYVSLNEGLMKSKGKYIARVDSDDTLRNNMLEENLKAFNRHNWCLVTRFKYIREGSIGKFGEIAMTYNKKIIEKIGFYDSVRFSADTEFRIRIKKYYKPTVVNKVLYYAKKRDNSLTTSESTGNLKIRAHYAYNYRRWHANNKIIYMPYPLIKRPFAVDPVMLP